MAIFQIRGAEVSFGRAVGKMHSWGLFLAAPGGGVRRPHDADRTACADCMACAERMACAGCMSCGDCMARAGCMTCAECMACAYCVACAGCTAAPIA